MWTAIVEFLPFLQSIINWWSGVEAAQTAATTAEGDAITAHQNDGGQSVADKVSDDTQNTDLDQQAKDMDNPKKG